MLTWNRKGKGNTACMESDRLREDVKAELLQDSHTMVKAGLRCQSNHQTGYWAPHRYNV
jgi:hypothetical protein